MNAGPPLDRYRVCLILSILAALCLLPININSMNINSANAAQSPAEGGKRAHSPTLAERLGYAPDAKLLIVHADDLGVAHSVDAASIKAFETGQVNSGSIMVPCPWLPEIAAYARAHPETDLGLHLTLTSEWATYRWGPVMSKDRVPSLLNKEAIYTRRKSKPRPISSPRRPK